MIPKKELQDIEIDRNEPWGVRSEYIYYLECPKCDEKIEVN